MMRKSFTGYDPTASFLGGTQPAQKANLIPRIAKAEGEKAWWENTLDFLGGIGRVVTGDQTPTNPTPSQNPLDTGLQKKSNTALWVGVGVATLIVVGLTIYLIVRKKK